MKTDARVRYTISALKQSFLKLLKTKPVNKITVKEVCDVAELNRATFYTHFSDCYDLLERIENDLIEDFTKSLKYVNTFDVTRLIEAIYDMIDKNYEVCKVLVFENANVSLLNKMIDIAKKASILTWKKELTKAKSEELDMLYTHLSHGLMCVVIDTYGKYDKKTVAGFINLMAKNSTAAFR